MYGVEEVKKQLENKIEDFYSLLGVQRFLLKRKFYGFIDLCGQLRFQKRWARTVRIPRTSVMGHMLMVAILSYAVLKRKGLEDRDVLYSTFFSALFHDLPEIITRDIISPIKNQLGADIVKEAEIEGVREEIYPLLPEYIRKEISCFLAIPEEESEVRGLSEFSNRICKFKNGKISVEILSEEGFWKQVEGKDKEKEEDEKVLLIPGSLIKRADKTSAYAEAIYSINFGLRSKELMRAEEELRKELLKTEFAEVVESLKNWKNF